MVFCATRGVCHLTCHEMRDNAIQAMRDKACTLMFHFPLLCNVSLCYVMKNMSTVHWISDHPRFKLLSKYFTTPNYSFLLMAQAEEIVNHENPCSTGALCTLSKGSKSWSSGQHLSFASSLKQSHDQETLKRFSITLLPINQNLCLSRVFPGSTSNTVIAEFISLTDSIQWILCKVHSFERPF